MFAPQFQYSPDDQSRHFVLRDDNVTGSDLIFRGVHVLSAHVEIGPQMTDDPVGAGGNQVHKADGRVDARDSVNVIAGNAFLIQQFVRHGGEYIVTDARQQSHVRS